MDTESNNSYWNSQIILAFFTTVLSLVLVYKLLRKNRGKLPPGPKGWPIVGNLPETLREPMGPLVKKYREKYGDVFTIQLGSETVVVLNTLETVRETLVEKQNDFAGRPRTLSNDLFGDNGNSMAFGDFTEAWKLMRKIGHAALRKYATGQQFENLIHNSFDKMVDFLKKEKGPVDPLNIMSILIYDLIFNMTCGKNWEFDDPHFKEFFDALENVNATFGTLLGDYFPALKWIPTPAAMQSKKWNKEFKSLLSDAMEEHRKTFDPENMRDVCDSVIFCEKEAAMEHGSEINKKLKHEHFVNILSDITLAGTDTSRYTLLWVLVYMVRNPDCQRKLQEEVDQVAGKQGLILADRSKLPYTTAVLHEVMRIRTLVPFALPRKTTCNTTIGQYELPKGTEVWANMHALHHDERYWKNPEQFDVSRFLDSDGTFSGVPASFKPFGTGRRVCVGESVAKAELIMLIAMLFQKFDVSAPEGATISDECLPIWVVLLPKPFKVVFKLRK